MICLVETHCDWYLVSTIFLCYLLLLLSQYTVLYMFQCFCIISEVCLKTLKKGCRKMLWERAVAVFIISLLRISFFCGRVLKRDPGEFMYCI